jgi:hypothetical protein
MRHICIFFCLLLSGCFDFESNSNWSFTTSKDKITDKEGFLAFARSKSSHGAFVIACDPKATGFLKPEVFADRPLAYRGGSRQMFIVRIDSEAPIFLRWRVIESAAVLDPEDEGIEHLAAYIANGSNLIVRMQSSDERDFDMEFDVRGLRKAIDHMSEKCTG